MCIRDRYYERRSLREQKPLFFTPYSVAVLASNGCFSHAAADVYKTQKAEENMMDLMKENEENRRWMILSVICAVITVIADVYKRQR